MRRLLFVWILLLIPEINYAEVTRVEIATRTDVMNGEQFGSAGSYEQLVGRIYFSIDPQNPRNRVIADLDRAPKNASGRIEMSSDLKILRPKDSAKGNGALLIDIVNRGTDTVISGFNRGTANNLGDGFLMKMGYTIVWVGWEFDTPQRNGSIRIDVPTTQGVSPIVHAMTTPNARSASAQFSDLASYIAGDPASPQNTLTIRNGPLSKPITIERSR